MSKDLGLCANRPADRCRVTISRGQENLLTISGSVQYVRKMRSMIETVAATMASANVAGAPGATVSALGVSKAIFDVCNASTTECCTDRRAVRLGSGLTLVVTPIWSANT